MHRNGMPNPTNKGQGRDLGWRGRFISDYGPRNRNTVA